MAKSKPEYDGMTGPGRSAGSEAKRHRRGKGRRVFNYAVGDDKYQKEASDYITARDGEKEAGYFNMAVEQERKRSGRSGKGISSEISDSLSKELGKRGYKTKKYKEKGTEVTEVEAPKKYAKGGKVRGMGCAKRGARAPRMF